MREAHLRTDETVKERCIDDRIALSVYDVTYSTFRVCKTCFEKIQCSASLILSLCEIKKDNVNEMFNPSSHSFR